MKRKRRFFTLPEVVAVMCIMGLLAMIAVPLLRSPSPASVLEQAGLDFSTFCSRVRYQAMESGADRIVAFDPETHSFIMLEPGASEEEETAPELKWKMPEDFEFHDESQALDPESLYTEVFRFFPDGGASGIRKLRFRYGKFTKEFQVSLLTGVLDSRDIADGEDGL